MRSVPAMKSQATEDAAQMELETWHEIDLSRTLKVECWNVVSRYEEKCLSC